jgi:sugar O-acyltransferase (sialic acid O-acetyltransferase NeuD family)
VKYYGIVGAGGFGREVMPVAREMLGRSSPNGDYELVFVDENLNKEKIINGHRAVSIADFLSMETDKKYFNIAIADYKNRERIANRMLDDGIKPFTIQALNYSCLDGNTIGEGAIFCSFTHVTSDARIGRFFHCNIYSYVAHYCIIGDFVTFAPSVHCNGGVVVEDYAYIGTGAIIRQGTDERPIVIGKGCIVGMGAVVTKSVPPFTTVIGNPAVELSKK